MQLRNHSVTVLVATDVAARGLDIPELDAVFNFELPTQAPVYVHRIGRTGRAEASGIAISLVAPRELERMAAIIELAPTLEEAAPDERLSQAVAKPELSASMRTIEVNGGRKHKLRAGDLLGAITADGKVAGSEVGRIELMDYSAYIAVNQNSAALAQQRLNDRIKGRLFRARILRS